MGQKPTTSKASLPRRVLGENSIPPSPAEEENPASPGKQQHPKNSTTAKEERVFENKDQVTPPALPPPPPAPRRWRWQCHECGFVYPLACTRRCLYCSHEFCTNLTPYREKRRSSRRQRGWICRSEFDYRGWEAWGTYRRTKEEEEATDYDVFATWELTTENSRTMILGRRIPSSPQWLRRPQAERYEVARRKQKMYVQGKQDCLLHCDFPSECLHAIDRAWAEGRLQKRR
ncbi:hypothetical protein C8A03DRAFT_14377 [Achaetomium macrosporum]|uniref:Uncharacterized protein n=1 Tax=Achaetomium macrosporum TaxID=79813 RepID=A0AAN7CBY0_9PEZI|nr:hypothetical protein C8A03DRAFT_14377 [Achaetomium macrosporum]